jgi:hypothetical protein
VSAKAEKPYHGSLVDPRSHGWILEQSWPELFDLYVKDGEAQAVLAPELNARRNALTRGHSVDDGDVAAIETALYYSCLVHMGMEGGAGERSAGDSVGFDYWRREIGNDVAATLGPIVKEIFTAKTSHQADLAANGLINLVKRAARGVVRIKFPGATRGNSWRVPKAVTAIWVARQLCEKHRRLPTKTEVRQRLEAIGVCYARSNDSEAKWRQLFATAGLGDLPD